MSTVKFDTDAIQELANRIAGLAELLRGAARLPVLTAEQFGSSVLAARVEDFTRDWSDGMDRIVGELDHTRTLLIEAARQYGQAETEVHGAVENTK